MKQILSYLKPYKKQITIGLLIKSTATFAELLLPMILAHMLDAVVPTRDLTRIFLFGGLMVLCALFGYIGNIYANRHAARISTKAIEAVRNDTYERIIYFTNQNTDAFKIPSLISRMTTDTYHVYRMFNVVQRIGIRAPIILLGSLFLMIKLDTYLAMVLIGLLPVMVLVIYLISKNSLPFYNRLQISLDGMIRVVRERISGIRVIKALSKEEQEKLDFVAINEDVSNKEEKAGMLVSLLNPIMNMILNLGLVLIIYIGVSRVQKGLSTTGNIIAFLSYFTQILNAFLTINRIFMLFSKAQASSNRINEILNADNTVKISAADGDGSDNVIEFDNVSFSYLQNGKYQLQDISFSIKRNQTFGIIGTTGSGKSTIAQLLLRFYDATKGTIRIDGKPIGSYPLTDLRIRFGVVFQNDVLFTDSVANNIRFGREVSLPDMEAAATMAQAAFVYSLPHGFEEHVQRGGANFSGGQRQRLLIARALAKRPEILILDDASSALDYQTDAKLRQALRSEETTTIYIAQRISTVMQADQILVLDDGKAVGLGTHEELMAHCKAYQELYQIQLGGAQ